MVGPYAVIGPQVRLGRGNRVGASAVIDGDTEIGDDCHVLSFASVGQIPQDLKFRGEATGLRIGTATSSASSSPSIAARAGAGG